MTEKDPRDGGSRSRIMRAWIVLFAAGALAYAAGIACRREARPPPRQASRVAASQWLRAADAAEAPLERALADFDAAARGSVRANRDLAARAVLSAARSARETLEGIRVPPDLEYARWEELVFLNHLVPGFQAFLAGQGTPLDLQTLGSVRERALAHRRRGREAIGLPES